MRYGCAEGMDMIPALTRSFKSQLTLSLHIVIRAFTNLELDCNCQESAFQAFWIPQDRIRNIDLSTRLTQAAPASQDVLGVSYTTYSRCASQHHLAVHGASATAFLM